MIDNCAACQKTRPSQQSTPMTAKKPSESQGAPLEHVGTDLFEYTGKHYLVVVDLAMSILAVDPETQAYLQWSASQSGLVPGLG